MKRVCAKSPKCIVGTVSKGLWGTVSVKNPCELPRNERQAMYIKKKEFSSQPSFSNETVSDQLFSVMLSAKSEDVNGKFVRDTRPCPEPAFVVARDRQLDDLVRFCTPAYALSILTVDPTFNLGDFDVTPITYRYCLLKSVRTNNPLVFIGPTLIHYKKRLELTFSLPPV